VTPILTGLNSPEGLTFDPRTGDMYVVEDTQNGRLIERAADGTVSTLAYNLDAPEGVTWADGTLYLTESNLQFAEVQDVRTRVAAFVKPATLTRVITDTPVVEGNLVHAWSYAGIATGPDGRLYVTNELSGHESTHTVVVIPDVLTVTLTLTSTDSVFAVDPAAGTRALLVSGLTAPEGLHFSANGGFPLYVAEEDLGDGKGRVSVVDADGRHAPFCTGFGTIEDVALDARGNLYVSEDGSGTVILIERESTAPGPVPIQAVTIEGPERTLIGRERTFTAAVTPLSATLPITYQWSATGQAPAHARTLTAGGGLSDTAAYAWSQPGPQVVTVRAINRAGSVTATHALTVYEHLYADFGGAPRTGIAPLTVVFTNTSSGNYQSRQWDLGDGHTSILEHPTHTYRAPGSYSVTLTVVGPQGSDSRTEADYIAVLWGGYLPLIFRPL
jgi:sugar lactone lactonase YvrE